MRRKVVNFRADDALVAALTQQAQKAGVTDSEIIHSAVREHVAPDAPPDPDETQINPFA